MFNNFLLGSRFVDELRVGKSGISDVRRLPKVGIFINVCTALDYGVFGCIKKITSLNGEYFRGMLG